MNKHVYYLIITALFCFGTTAKFAHSHDDMPVGCDEFGYLNLAKTSDNLSSRTYLNELLDTLRKASITEAEISWMVTPHAYHVIPGTKKIINQYPPGTSYLLKMFPLKFRKVMFPLLVMVLLIIIPLLITRTGNHKKWNLFDLMFPLLLFIVTISAPFTTELSRVNSLAVTFGLLLAAGITLKSRPLLAVFLIALTVNFRIANILMVIPVLFFLPSTNLNDQNKLVTVGRQLFKFGAITLIACLPLLIYNYLLLGNPLGSTYSAIDTAVNEGNKFTANLTYYLNFNHHWFRIHIITLILLIVFTFTSRLSIRDFIKILFFPLVNYLFFGWHAVTMDYYPYASAMLLTGILLGIFVEIFISGKYNYIIPVAGMLLALTVLISGINRYRKKEHLDFEAASEVYAGLCNYKIVWCDLFSGTTEYVCGNNGFRYATSTPRARKITLQFLYDNNFDQVLILNDIPLPATTISLELTSAGLTYLHVTDKYLGPLLVIAGRENSLKSTSL